MTNVIEHPVLNQKYLKEAFDYDPDTGILRWKERPDHHFTTPWGAKRFNKLYTGTVVTSTSKCRSQSLTVHNVSTRVKIVIWIISYGTIPEYDVIYKSNDRTDTRLSNLMLGEVSHRYKNPVKGGLSICVKRIALKNRDAWKLCGYISSKPIYIKGSWDTKEEALAEGERLKATYVIKGSL